MSTLNDNNSRRCILGLLNTYKRITLVKRARQARLVLRRESWVMTSLIFRLANSDTRHVGISDFGELRGVSLKWSIMALRPYKT
jgi:hypothetical protein